MFVSLMLEVIPNQPDVGQSDPGCLMLASLGLRPLTDRRGNNSVGIQVISIYEFVLTSKSCNNPFIINYLLIW